ncbi:MAG: OB-fold domain-containing protein [Acidimicrobiales bacterium]
MAGIIGYGAYVPFHRLDRSAIAGALGGRAGKGTRAVASFDEDTTSMGVEAARDALGDHGSRPVLDGLAFATVAPAYLDKTNATAVHAALGQGADVGAWDRAGSTRSAVLALHDALECASRRTLLTVLADIRTGLPGSSDETTGGDAAVALITGPGDSRHPVLAEPVATASATGELLDRWRVPGEVASRTWEERFGEFAYAPMVEAAFTRALERADLKPGDVDHLVVSGTHRRVADRFAKASGVPGAAIADGFHDVVGYTGAAHLGLVVADVLDRARPGDHVVAVSVADGADVVVLRVTEALPAYRKGRRTVRDRIDAGRSGLGYATYLSWRGLLQRDPPRRPDPARPAAPPSLRSEHWKFALVGNRGTAPVAGGRECGARHLPPQLVCMVCTAHGQMVPQPFADTPGVVSALTIDHLAYSPSPPLVAAVVDFDGGGRYRFEMTDVDPGMVAVGDRVEMTFRCLYTTVDGVHDYFWKARPAR